MNRTYSNTETNTASFFVGDEIEKTPAYGMKTLFVVGKKTIEAIDHWLNTEEDINHIFFGANHSFNPHYPGSWVDWNNTIEYFLKTGKTCSLDIPVSSVNEFNEKTNLCQYEKFIPQIRIPVANINKWSYNTMIKLDDITFNATNAGIWTNRLSALQDDSAFTSWDDYNNDTLLK